MRRAASLLATGLLAASLLPGAVMACDPMPRPVSLVPEEDLACALAWQPEDHVRVELEGARNLGQSIAVQQLSEGNACDVSVRLVVHDCLADEVLVICSDRRVSGYPEGHALNRTGLNDLALQVLSRGPTLDEVERSARARGYDEATRLIPGEAILVAGVAVPLGCACERFSRSVVE